MYFHHITSQDNVSKTLLTTTCEGSLTTELCDERTLSFGGFRGKTRYMTLRELETWGLANQKCKMRDRLSCLVTVGVAHGHRARAGWRVDQALARRPLEVQRHLPGCALAQRRARIHGRPESVAQAGVAGPGPAAGAGSHPGHPQFGMHLRMLLLVLHHEVSGAGPAAWTRTHARHAEPRLLRLRQLSCNPRAHVEHGSAQQGKGHHHMLSLSHGKALAQLHDLHQL